MSGWKDGYKNSFLWFKCEISSVTKTRWYLQMEPLGGSIRLRETAQNSRYKGKNI